MGPAVCLMAFPSACGVAPWLSGEYQDLAPAPRRHTYRIGPVGVGLRQTDAYVFPVSAEAFTC